MAFDSSAVFGAGSSAARKAGRQLKTGSGGVGCDDQDQDLSREDIAFFGNAIAIASRQWRAAIKRIRDEYSLGPHGPWIVGLIAANKVVYPSELTRILRCGRSLISAELNKLSDAGLINCRKSDEDGRQIELTVTPLGLAANEQVAESLAGMLEERLGGYSRDEILYCARILRDLAGPNPEIS